MSIFPTVSGWIDNKLGLDFLVKQSNIAPLPPVTITTTMYGRYIIELISLVI